MLSTRNAKIVFLYFHGNAGNRATSHRISFYKILTGLDADSHVVAVDYRGFGNSSSKIPCEKSLKQDAKCAFDWIVDQGVPLRNIVVVGHSLGSGIATDLVYSLSTNDTHCRGLIILSGYASIADAAIGYPVVPVLRPFHGIKLLENILKYFIRDKWVSHSKMRSISNLPMLLLHGGADIEINIWQAKALFLSAVEGRNGNQYLNTDGFWELRAPMEFDPCQHKVQINNIGDDGELWTFGDLDPIWLLRVTHAGHNNLSNHQIVRDTLNSWINFVGQKRPSFQKSQKTKPIRRKSQRINNQK